MYNPVTEKWGDIERVVSGYGWSEPMAAFDPAGNLFLWWYNEGGIVYSLAKVDGKWENVHRLSSWNIGKQGGIAVGSDGQVWTVWREKEGDGEYKNWYAKRTASSDWSKPQRVNDAGASSSHPHITVGPDNVPVTAYGDIDEATGHAQQMWICTIDEKTNPRELVLDAYMQHYPRIAIDINGKIHLACQLGGGDYGDGIRYTNNVLGEWKHTQGFKASWPKLPGIAADAFGNVGLCWSSIAFADNTSGIWFTSLYEVKPQANEPPVADFSFSPQRGIAPLRVNFDASPSYDPDGNIVAYEWNYGDGKTATGETVAHTFKRGIYSVTLTVTDNRGDTASKTKYVDASVSMYPPLNLTIDTAVNNLRKVPEVTYNLGWQANPQNEAEFFQGYKIYKKEEGGTWQLLVSVTGTTYSASFNFKDPQVRRQFAMTAFATTGKESEMVFFGSQ
jgi:PKD repeat protein